MNIVTCPRGAADLPCRFSPFLRRYLCSSSGNHLIYVVKPGDCMASIAVEHNFLWETLWNLPENAALKDSRQDPYVLLPGDQVFIPELRPKEVPRATDNFTRKGVRECLRIVITD